MKLYDLPRGAKIYVDSASDGSMFVIFDHVDGMYSFCETEKGNPVHLSAMSPLKEKGDGYEIAAENETRPPGEHKVVL